MNIIHIFFGAKFLAVAKVLCRKLNDLKKKIAKIPQRNRHISTDGTSREPKI